ncbi:restriction endonuclease [Henriciella algicola]|uniref:Restriction endonuclease n=1 Tax=Henriciella algicola TaxID=1608422 RepID=A0A399RHC1_9PROT|nr:restriction endonuclease [Henriciella algicola]RIJ31040.1 restriction endonuclease [Henriciella algicola]
MPQITSFSPETWQQLEEVVRDILSECGMDAQRNVSLSLPRGGVDVDVLATETVDGITHRTICECKNWNASVPRSVVHAFRTVMIETGVNTGCVISRNGFQTGALEAADATNIKLFTFDEFQNFYFLKWFKRQIWELEDYLDGFHEYYEPPPFGKPGYEKLQSDDQRQAYDSVWEKYHFAGLILPQFSPYLNIIGQLNVPTLPLNFSEIDRFKIRVPQEIREASAHRELFAALKSYGREGLEELRSVNPNIS